jgi:hypothetical protein
MSSERRAHPRIELVATVEVARDGEVHVLMASNLSLSGVFLEGNPADYPGFERNALLEMTLSLAESTEGAESGGSPPRMAIKAKGKIVRIQPPGMKSPAGFGLVLTEIRPAELKQLNDLLRAQGSRTTLP